MLARAADRRVRQFWDPKRRVASLLDAGGALGDSTVLRAGGVAWDVLVVYPPGERLGERPPRPRFAGSTVVEWAADLAAVLAAP